MRLTLAHLRSLAALLLLPVLALAQPAKPLADQYVSAQKSAGSFPLVAGGRAATLYASESDWPGVLRAARDVQADIRRVTGQQPALLTTMPQGKQPVVLIGTVGHSPLIDGLVRAGKLDAKNLAGRWEAFVVQAVDQPMPGVAQALVVAGSDKRGTIYGLYDLSQQMGVSPWYWWADVPVAPQKSLYVAAGRHTLGEPAVKYRGIFINDEAPALSGWSKEKFGGVNSKMYEHMFELILRLKGNYLWPAMWGNAFNDDDKQSPVLADMYGVVMGNSHHEPMLRAQQEWKRYGKGAWNYQTNAPVLQDFWRQGIRNMGTHESIVTIGMRGDGDEPMTEGSNIALLEKIVADQRQILTEETHKPADQTPQLWALYKEVQAYYDKGMRVPDDVTLLLCDDNWGDVRKLPKLGAPPRRGGYGIYYHFDYVGDPRNYKWLNTNPLPRIREQMNLAKEYGADKIWIVNVGDLKPLEYPISFFLDFAWNPARYPADALDAYGQQWAARQFGPAHAPAIAAMLAEYAKYNARRKPELLDADTYSLLNYREFETVVADYNRLAARADALNQQLPADQRDAYFELVLHPIKACANLNELYYTVALNRLYARQGRASTNALADRARQLYAADSALSLAYNRLAGGKWNHMMDQTHIGYTYWQQPPFNKMPTVRRLEVPAAASVAVVPEGAELPAAEALLPAFSRWQQSTHFIDVFNKGQAGSTFTVAAGQPWLRITPPAPLGQEQRLLVSVDWAKAPAGTTRVPITISSPAGPKSVVVAVVENAAEQALPAGAFGEADGYVALEADHYSRAVGGGPVQWLRLPDLGRTGSAVTVTPAAVPPVAAPGGASPHLEYRVHLTGGGPVTVRAYLAPTLDFTNTTGLRYAVSFDDEAPQLVNIHKGLAADPGNKLWEKAVAENIIVTPSQHTLAQGGEHVLKFWLVDPGLVLERLVIDRGGLKPSYLGPPESYRRPAASAATGGLGQR